MNINRNHSVILCNIRSAHNVGSIFRTIDAVGISRVYLTGITPTPRDRFGRERGDIAKTALGAEKNVEWGYAQNIEKLLEKFKNNNVRIISVEQSAQAIDYKTLKVAEPSVFIFGNEISGISQDILKKSDQIIEIPMRGKKESLNVSVAVGIVLFRLLDN